MGGGCKIKILLAVWLQLAPCPDRSVSRSAAAARESGRLRFQAIDHVRSGSVVNILVLRVARCDAALSDVTSHG